MDELPGISIFGQPDGMSQTQMSQKGKKLLSKYPKSYKKIFREKRI